VVLETVTKNSKQAVAVVDESGRLMGLITDGDIRRAILRGSSLDATVDTVMNRHPTAAAAGIRRQDAIAIMQRREIRHLPLTDARGIFTDLLLLDELFEAPELPNSAVLMAGGFGRRLAPLTEETPKPLLKVGGKPIIEIMIERLRAAGIRDVFMTLHYKKQMIADHFGNGDRLGVRIRYHYEEAPRGTAGSLADFRGGTFRAPFLVVNADILTKCDFREMLTFHGKHHAAMTVGTVPYAVDLPYGILEVEGEQLAAVKEKPRLDFMINSGIYVLSPMVLDTMKLGSVLDMPDLIANLKRDGFRVVAFPIREYWLDVGRHDDLSKADRDVAEGLLE
jgi:dTDP-glucose pyrophosphorylase